MRIGARRVPPALPPRRLPPPRDPRARRRVTAPADRPRCLGRARQVPVCARRATGCWGGRGASVRKSRAAGGALLGRRRGVDPGAPERRNGERTPLPPPAPYKAARPCERESRRPPRGMPLAGRAFLSRAAPRPSADARAPRRPAAPFPPPSTWPRTRPKMARTRAARAPASSPPSRVRPPRILTSAPVPPPLRDASPRWALRKREYLLWSIH